MLWLGMAGGAEVLRKQDPSPSPVTRTCQPHLRGGISHEESMGAARLP